MASDRRQFERAQSHWEALRQQEKFSCPSDEGVVAILTSDFPFYQKNSDDVLATNDDEQDRQNFIDDAFDYAHKLGALGVASDIIHDATANDLDDAIRDEEVSSIVVIGHGSISDILLRGKKNGLYDWRDAAKATTHLKTGSFVQRQCGIFNRELNIPLGLFVVDSPSQVFAAKGKVFDPIEFPEDNSKIKRVFSPGSEISYASLKKRLSYDEVLPA